MKTEVKGVEVELLGHASIKLQTPSKTVYIDPWSEVIEEFEKADIIVSTHDHFDHFDLEAIEKLRKEDTLLLCTKQSEDSVPEDLEYKIIETGSSVETGGVVFKGVEAYNIDKFREENMPFHPKGFCVGLVFELDGLKIYYASDTDSVPEMEQLKDEDIGLAFLPIGGKYTMNQEEALEAVDMIEPERVVPMHYGVVDGTEADPEKFKENVEKEVLVLQDAEP